MRFIFSSLREASWCCFLSVCVCPPTANGERKKIIIGMGMGILSLSVCCCYFLGKFVNLVELLLLADGME